MRLGPRGGGGVIGVLILLIAVLLADAVDRDGGRSGPSDQGIERVPGGAGAGESTRADVVRVVDGDTIRVSIEGSEENVRYIGIDTPETVKPGTPVQCFGKQASSFNEALVTGEQVRLRFDRELRDRFGRLLAYVYVGDTFVNAELVRGGFARTLEIEPNTAMAGRLAELELDAGEAGRGLWSAC